MTYELFIGDRTFSSWSLRGWLMFDKFDIPVTTKLVGLYSGTMAKELEPLHPARLVPSLRIDGDLVIGDTFAIAETLAERHPDAGLWPTNPAARARARWLVAEMHSGFSALRESCPMQLERRWIGFEPNEATIADLRRLEVIWADAQTKFGANGPWLLGEYSLADVFYAPIAARIAGYGLGVSSQAQDYVDAHLADASFNAWRNEGLNVRYDPNPYDQGIRQEDWPK